MTRDIKLTQNGRTQADYNQLTGGVLTELTEEVHGRL